jgi:hypothetical protein
LTLQSLVDTFNLATKLNVKYVAVRIAIGLNKEEVIINPRENFKEKSAYYQHAYDDSLRHKFADDQDIRITGFAYGTTFSEIERKLEFYEVTGTVLN